MSLSDQIVIGFSFIVLFFSSIAVLAMNKPLRWWGIFLFAVGAQLFIFYPEQKNLASGMILVSVLYFIKGIRIFAYRRKNVLKHQNEEGTFLSQRFRNLRLLTVREWTGRIICLLGAVIFVAMFFPFRKIGGDIKNDLMYTAFTVLMIYYAWKLFYVVLLHIIAPLIVIKKESKKARLKDALMIERHIGKGIMAEEPYLFFEQEEYYVSYRRFSEQIGEIAGYVCEYTVYTDIFGSEFIRECPRAVSSDREFVSLVYAEDLKTGMENYTIGRRLQYEDSSPKSILPVLLGFFLPILLISVTMLLLYLFWNKLP